MTASALKGDSAPRAPAQGAGGTTAFVVDSFSPSAGIWNTKEHGHSSQIWFSAYPTNDGKIVDYWGNGHIQTNSNAVWTWDPADPHIVSGNPASGGKFTYIYKNNNGQFDWQMYDNLNTWYVPALNALLTLGSGLCYLDTGKITKGPAALYYFKHFLRTRGPNRATWPGGEYPENLRSLTFNAEERYSAEEALTFTPLSLDPDWAAVVQHRSPRAADNDLVYPHDATVVSSPWNAHVAWSAEHDVGIRVGGANDGNRAAEIMFRCPAAEAFGSPVERFIPERFRQAHAEDTRLPWS
jgi:hypothetical protein